MSKGNFALLNNKCMASLFYEEDRNEDFLQACEAVRKEEGVYLSISEIASKVILKPAKSFYLQQRIYIRIIRNNGEKLPKNEVSCELHKEVLHRAKEIMKLHPSYSPAKIAKILSEQEAPRFYMSESRAESLYYELLKQK